MKCYSESERREEAKKIYVVVVCYLLLVVRLYSLSGFVKLIFDKMQSRTWYDGKDVLKPPSVCDI